jgi:outer membrane protein assembly factor BamB
MHWPFVRPAFVTTLIAASIVIAAVSPANAQEWTRFRGPNGDGQSDASTIPTEWTEADFNWNIGLPGLGHSSPVLWGDKIFVTSADPTNGTRMFFAVRASDGHVLWTKEYASTTHKKHEFNSFASSTPACDAEYVYLAWATPEETTLLTLDHHGNEVWRKTLGKFVSQHGFGTSPVVHDGLVYITNDQDGESSVIAVDRSTGDTRWTIPRKVVPRQNASYSTPMIYTPPDGEPELIINSWAHGISSHDPKTGSVNWELPVFELRPVGSPILVAGLIFGSCGAGAGDNTVVAVRPGDKDGRKPEVAYQFKRRSSTLPYVPTMVAAGNLVFLWGDKGFVSCIDAPTGKFHYEQKRVSGAAGSTYFSSPIRIGDRIFGISTVGEVVVLAAAPEFKVLARYDLGDATHATPAVAHGRMYVRTQTKLMSIGGKKG